MSTNSNTGKKKYFAYVTAPEHVTTDLIKLNGIQFNSKYIIVKEPTNKLTSFSEANILTPISPVFRSKHTCTNITSFPKQTYLHQYHQFFVII